jgi:hypothetical protein
VILHKVPLWQLVLSTALLIDSTQAHTSSNSGQLYIDIVDTTSNGAVHSSSSNDGDSADVFAANMTYVQLKTLRAPVRKLMY